MSHTQVSITHQLGVDHATWCAYTEANGGQRKGADAMRDVLAAHAPRLLREPSPTLPGMPMPRQQQLRQLSATLIRLDTATFCSIHRAVPMPVGVLGLIYTWQGGRKVTCPKDWRLEESPVTDVKFSADLIARNGGVSTDLLRLI